MITCLAFLAIATYVAYRGIDATEKVQIVLVSFQMIVLLVFAVMAIAKHETTGGGTDFSWSWFSPAGLTLSAFIVGLSGSIFGFWGWDTALTVNEESKDSDTTPGKAALLCVLSILATYLIVTIAMQMFAGMGETGLGLRNEEVSDNVFGNLAEPVMGFPLSLVLYLAVLASSAASLITTFLPTSRTLLAMASYGAMPKRFAHIHPKYKSPSTATFAAGIGAAIFYTVMTILSEKVLTDTILSLGIMICFYYGLVAFGCIWFFRKMLFENGFNFVFKFLFPLLGGIGLFVGADHHVARQRRPRVRQRGQRLRHRAGPRPRPRADPDRHRLHAADARPAARLLQERDAEARGRAQHEAARAPGVLTRPLEFR